MSFHVVFTKSRKLFDKYVKVNKIKSKVIIDIKLLLEEYGIDNYLEYRDYFNLMIYTKIIQSIEKKKDIYYIPNLENVDFDMEEIIKISDLVEGVKFNSLIFYDEFKDDGLMNESIIEYMNVFDASQILKSY